MATILNRDPWAKSLPSGHVIPAATGKWSEDGFVCTAPGALTTSNDVLRGDNATVLRGPAASGALSVGFDPDPEPVTAVQRDYLQAQMDEQAAVQAEVAVEKWKKVFGIEPVPFAAAMAALFDPKALDAMVEAVDAMAEEIAVATPEVIAVAEVVAEVPAPVPTRK